MAVEENLWVTVQVADTHGRGRGDGQCLRAVAASAALLQMHCTHQLQCGIVHTVHAAFD